MNNKVTAYTEQPEPDSLPEQAHPMTGFFAIGIAINLLLITAYFIWAYKQWKKNNRRDEEN
jgi:hypothetical protein